MGLAQPGDFYRPPATRLTGALSRTPRRPDAGGASIVPILPPTWSSRWPIGTPARFSALRATYRTRNRAGESARSLCSRLFRAQSRSVPATPGSDPQAHRPRTQPQARRDQARRWPVHRMRQASPRRRRRELRVLSRCAPRRRAGIVRIAPCRRAVRHVRGPHDRRRLAVRALRRRRVRALSEQERRPPRGVLQTPCPGTMHRLRRAIARSGPLRALCSPVA